MTKNKEKIESKELENAINSLKEGKVQRGVIPDDKKRIKIVGDMKDFSGMTLKITKGVVKNDIYKSYKAGTKWEDIDVFGRKNIHFSESDFK